MKYIDLTDAEQREIVQRVQAETGLNQQIIGVLDVDSEYLNHFDAIDQKYLGEILSLIRP